MTDEVSDLFLLDLPLDMLRVITSFLDPFSKLAFFFTNKLLYKDYAELKLAYLATVNQKAHNNDNDEEQSEFSIEAVAGGCAQHGRPDLVVWLCNYLSPSRPPAPYRPDPMQKVFNFFNTIFVSPGKDPSEGPLLDEFFMDAIFVRGVLEVAAAHHRKDFIYWVKESSKEVEWTAYFAVACAKSGDLAFATWALDQVVWPQARDRYRSDLFSLFQGVMEQGFIEFFDYLVSWKPKFADYIARYAIERNALYSAAARCDNRTLAIGPDGKEAMSRSLFMLKRIIGAIETSASSRNQFDIDWSAIARAAVLGGNTDCLSYVMEESEVAGKPIGSVFVCEFIEKAINQKNLAKLKVLHEKLFAAHIDKLKNMSKFVYDALETCPLEIVKLLFSYPYIYNVEEVMDHAFLNSSQNVCIYAVETLRGKLKPDHYILALKSDNRSGSFKLLTDNNVALSMKMVSELIYDSQSIEIVKFLMRRGHKWSDFGFGSEFASKSLYYKVLPFNIYPLLPFHGLSPLFPYSPSLLSQSSSFFSLVVLSSSSSSFSFSLYGLL